MKEDAVSTAFLIKVVRTAARDLEPGVSYVLREYLPPNPNDKFTQSEFERAVRKLQEVNSECDNVVLLHGFFIYRKRFYIVEAYHQGETLEETLARSQPLGEADACRLLRELLEIVGRLHDLGVVHGDIDTQALLRRDGDGKLMLTDFGILKDATQLAKSNGSYTLSPNHLRDYMPPERKLGQTNQASDVYMLATTMLRLVSGKPLAELYDPVNQHWVWNRVNTPASLRVLITLMTGPPEVRLQTGAEVASVLDMLERIKAGQRHYDKREYAAALDEWLGVYGQWLKLYENEEHRYAYVRPWLPDLSKKVEEAERRAETKKSEGKKVSSPAPLDLPPDPPRAAGAARAAAPEPVDQADRQEEGKAAQEAGRTIPLASYRPAGREIVPKIKDWYVEKFKPWLKALVPQLVKDHIGKFLGYGLLFVVGWAATQIPKWLNHEPVVSLIHSESQYLGEGQTLILTADASDPDKDNLTYVWKCSAGDSLIKQDGSRVARLTTATLPPQREVTSITVTVIANDKYSSSKPSSPISISIIPNQPVVQYLLCSGCDDTKAVNEGETGKFSVPFSVNEGETVTLSLLAHDPDNERLTFDWSFYNLKGKDQVQPFNNGGLATVKIPRISPLMKNDPVIRVAVTVSDIEGKHADYPQDIIVKSRPTTSPRNPHTFPDNSGKGPVLRDLRPDNFYVTAGKAVVLKAKADDPNGSRLEFDWQCSPTLPIESKGETATLDTSKITRMTRLTVTVTVKNQRGLTASGQTRIIVVPPLTTQPEM